MKRILVVDDEWAMRNLIKMHLSDEYEVVEADNGFDALVMVEEMKPHLVILDIMMPQMNGWEVCENIRFVDQTPILMLTARNDLKDLIRGLEIGADDYLAKPFEPEELIARVNALMRRSIINEEHSNEKTIRFIGDMLIDHRMREVYVKGDLVDLTPKEFNMLELFVLNPKRVFSREVLLDQVWGINDVREARTVDSHIKNIRDKFRKTNLSFNPIKTVWGVGYRLDKPMKER
ncbi:response regulator transcription factor [Schinkia azotoformans]|uniref:response regulator transcription factor n=1 Tax=Schinkia azotoformans TaxID=1454 RepID=UPI002DBE9523|nr:response regulator transcription factor [Schinkia azotoformans]MEC1742796.1 response regulator transcription factor [Schinkia azotoformans]MEC1769031.1 response regulator transcription factor [Schinkia azotoformans]MEC1789616.1 response regulator transcription factor [Schinkia azotoformans]MED4378441.1 response regulator transcription factor [Schinkia azotoformans]MED4417416.1 response regulator transcription factor [Schinkia azotoformans]